MDVFFTTGENQIRDARNDRLQGDGNGGGGGGVPSGTYCVIS